MNDDQQLDERGLERTESGLVVPKDAVEANRVRRVITWWREDFRKIWKSLKWLETHGVLIIMVCKECHEMTIPRAVPGMTTFTCRCSVRQITLTVD